MYLITPSQAPARTERILRGEGRSPQDLSPKLYIAPVIALALIGCFAVLQLSRWPQRLRYPGEEDGAEGTQLAEMVHLRQGIAIYRTTSSGEFEGAIYGPFAYLLGAAVINPVHPSYLPLRLLSLAATVGLASLAAMFVFQVTRSNFGAMLAPLVLLSSPYVARYGISARADMLALFISFAGFLAFFLRRESRPALVAAGALMLLSIFYKQQFIGAPAAVFVYLIGVRQFRRALEFATVLGVGAALLVAMFTWVVFEHQRFFTHFFIYNRLPFDKTIIVPEILMFAIPLFVPLLGSADYCDTHGDGLLKAYALFTAGGYFLLLLSSGSGADTNRCLEAVLVLSCLLAARIATAPGVVAGLSWTGGLACTLVLLALLPSAFVVPVVREQDFVADGALQTYLRGNFPPGTSALSYYPADPLRAGLAVPITNLWHYTALIRKGLISDRDIVDRILRKGYGVILLDYDLNPMNAASTGDFYTTKSMRDAILASYYDAAQLELPTPEVTRFSSKTVHIWVPRIGERR